MSEYIDGAIEPSYGWRRLMSAPEVQCECTAECRPRLSMSVLYYCVCVDSSVHVDRTVLISLVDDQSTEL